MTLLCNRCQIWFKAVLLSFWAGQKPEVHNKVYPMSLLLYFDCVQYYKMIVKLCWPFNVKRYYVTHLKDVMSALKRKKKPDWDSGSSSL